MDLGGGFSGWKSRTPLHTMCVMASFGDFHFLYKINTHKKYYFREQETSTRGHL